MNEEKLKQKVQSWIVAVSCLILLGKFTAYFLTHSVAVLTDALESIVNVVAGFISLYSLHWAARPKDKDHPFGHGKMELISASIEGLLVTAAGIMIIYEGVSRLLEPVLIYRLDVGIGIVAVAGVLNYGMGWYSVRIGRRYGSMALVASGRHLQSDTYSTIGLVAGLLFVYFTGIAWIDSALALVFGGVIIWAGVSILRKTVDNLLDRADVCLLEDLAEALNANRCKEWVDVHNVKVIKSGNYLYLDCDLTIPWYYNIEQGHLSGRRLTGVLEAKYADRVQVTVHLDPCNIFDSPRCHQCSVGDCPYRVEAFRELEKISLSNLTQSLSEHDRAEK